ncbi:hypothetical protein ACIQ7Q_26130 [Streptomyces sp. NPDC096176]|uniref:hypothetical protein n=1 Tax=Streptomyces sp. NPDC096176 TaxID=3366079 RepID=UPI00381434C4
MLVTGVRARIGVRRSGPSHVGARTHPLDRSGGEPLDDVPEGGEFKRAGDEDHRAIGTAPANRDPAASAAAAHTARSRTPAQRLAPPVTEDAVDEQPNALG